MLTNARFSHLTLLIRREAGVLVPQCAGRPVSAPITPPTVTMQLLIRGVKGYIGSVEVVVCSSQETKRKGKTLSVLARTSCSNRFHFNLTFVPLQRQRLHKHAGS